MDERRPERRGWGDGSGRAGLQLGARVLHDGLCARCACL